MNKFVTTCTLLAILLVFAVTAQAGNRKIAQTGMKFLSVSTDARMSAMSNAVTSLDGSSSAALFYNPASMANAAWQSSFSLGKTKWIADINYVYGSFAYRPGQGQYGVFGLSFVAVDYGDFLGTIRAENEQGFLDVGTFSPSAYAIGLGYAKALSSKFSVGGHARYVKQDLVGGAADFLNSQTVVAYNYEQHVFAFDFGILYKTGFKSLTFGMNVHNFSREIQYIQESFQLPLVFEMGLSINMMDFVDVDQNQHSLLISLDAVHPRDFSEQIDFGLEYVFMKTFALRAGYTTPTDEQGLSFGLGIKQTIAGIGFDLDYAYTSFGVFEDIHRFTMKFSL